MAATTVLLVEGTDDLHVLTHLCLIRGVKEPDEVKDQRGVQPLLEALRVRLKQSDIATLGVVLDADTSLGGRWDALKDRLTEAGYDAVPDSPSPAGTIIDPPADKLLPRVGIWIMPDNQSNGILEDFLQCLIPTQSPLFQHVITSIATIPTAERRFSALAEPKAIVHTWLAWQEDPGNPFGTSIRCGYLDHSVPQVDSLVSWLERLFN
jgi:hypothetical protein